LGAMLSIFTTQKKIFWIIFVQKNKKKNSDSFCVVKMEKNIQKNIKRNLKKILDIFLDIFRWR